ncbi:altronate dehydratase family protein [Spiroplasma endosymbiont of Aspidapion aeneum]|uniref:UxaA family hydrolase n=1 Tax=Spiroplasma endosymbiont of Aspidapion aeneum TaxID=3066276 RepID=UPI00313C848B
MKKITILEPETDMVAVALENIDKGTKLNINNNNITLLSEIKRGHKFAIKKIESGENIIKYGYPIGKATSSINIGEWVHTHNMSTNLSGKLSYQYKHVVNKLKYPEKDKRIFKGYVRKNGKVGIRNDLYIIPTVGCINAVLEIVLRRFEQENPNHNFDNIVILKHPYGCSQLGGDFETTRKILIDAVLHPNAGGVLLFGLGCENNQMEGVIDQLKKIEDIDTNRLKFLIAQEVKDEIENSLKLLNELNIAAKDDKRTICQLSELKIGLKCGGSDGLSGVTANPLVGRLSDFICSNGGSTVLTEVPEMFGAEQILMNRAKDKRTFKEVVLLINNFKDYFESFRQPIYENPSPGNKEGGITTLEDKSLGCTQKSGYSQVNGVLKYGERIKVPGLSLLESPGNDLVSSTALASSGCQMILFTTGRGTPFATYVPTVKISSNSEIYNLKPHWIDFDAGRLMNEDMDSLAESFIQFIIDIASGEKNTNNEKNKINGFAIFKTGVTE